MKKVIISLTLVAAVFAIANAQTAPKSTVTGTTMAKPTVAGVTTVAGTVKPK